MSKRWQIFYFGVNNSLNCGFLGAWIYFDLNPFSFHWSEHCENYSKRLFSCSTQVWNNVWVNDENIHSWGNYPFNTLAQWVNRKWTFSLKWTLVLRPGVADVSVSENHGNPHSLPLMSETWQRDNVFILRCNAERSGATDRQADGRNTHSLSPSTNGSAQSTETACAITWLMFLPSKCLFML